MSKKVVLIRGPQGAGKSTLVRSAGLEGVNLSPDKIRNVVSGDALAPNGQFMPNHDHGPMVHRIFMESIDRRIAAGEVICIDATMPNGSEVYDLWKIFDQAGYHGLLIDLYGFDEALRRDRNAARPDRERVPEEAVRRTREMARRSLLPPIMLSNPCLEHFPVRDDAEARRAVDRITGFLQDPRCSRDLSAYREVLHIGDIQGCHSPLVSPLSPLRDGLDPEVFHIFLGDLFDRGKENGAVGAWFLREALGRPNVALIAGNHEDYVEMQATAGTDDINLAKSEWLRLTWPELKTAGLTARDMRKIADFAQDHLSYTWRDKTVLCSHAGFGRWPDRIELVSQYQMRRGNGRYGADVDALWSAAEAASGRYQVHGHRNESMAPTLAAPLSFNLEGQVEFGGHLRMLRLDGTGFSAVDIRPAVFRTMQEDVALNREVDRQSMSKFPPILPWAETGAEPGRLNPETLASFRDHEMIALKRLDSLAGLMSVNFTREAFHDARWDRYTTLARGLFIDSMDSSIVARSFPKFFNRNEVPETTDEALASGMRFPVLAFEKSNGFLCITGYSERLGRGIIASKSRADGTFADMAEDVLRRTIGEAGIERIMRLNRDQTASLVFEIEDPDRDPHIIGLERPNAVLLACIRRSEQFEQASHEDLQKIGAWIGCEVKKVVARIPNARALAAFNHRVETGPKWVFEGRRVEGCVLEQNQPQPPSFR